MRIIVLVLLSLASQRLAVSSVSVSSFSRYIVNNESSILFLEYAALEFLDHGGEYCTYNLLN